MSLPLKDCGSVKLSEDFHVFSLAQEIYTSKQLGAIAEDLKG